MYSNDNDDTENINNNSNKEKGIIIIKLIRRSAFEQGGWVEVGVISNAPFNINVARIIFLGGLKAYL